jgi:hypothetical protein
MQMAAVCTHYLNVKPICSNERTFYTGTCSLSELECWIVQVSLCAQLHIQDTSNIRFQFYPSIFHKPALKMAFRHSM